MASGVFKPETQFNHSSYGMEVTLITDDEARRVKKYEDLAVKAIRKGNTTKAFELYNKASAIFNNSARLPNSCNFAGDAYPDFEVVMDFIQQPKIRKALHVGNRTFENIGKAYQKLIPDIMNNVQSGLQELLNYYKFLFINGILGTVIPPRPMDKFLISLEFDNAVEFRQSPENFYLYNNTVAGYYKKATNITTMCLLRSGNLPIVDNPEQLLDIVTMFINDTLFE